MALSESDKTWIRSEIGTLLKPFDKTLTMLTTMIVGPEGNPNGGCYYQQNNLQKTVAEMAAQVEQLTNTVKLWTRTIGVGIIMLIFAALIKMLFKF
jgi:hypothetical protein